MQKVKNSKATSDAAIEEMFKAGAHYGYSKTRRHPSVSSFIYTTKNRADIINLEKTSELLEEAKAFMEKLGAGNKTILFVGTKPEAKSSTRDAAMALSMPFVTERWIGGTISNYGEIKRRIAELENYYKEEKGGGLEKYTKKERVMMAKKMEKLARYYTGLLTLKKTPDALFIVDAKYEHIAATEARKAGIPVITLVNSDVNLKGIDYPIVANDASIPSIKFFTKAVTEAYKEGQKTATPK